ncbi:hypothetical protein H6G06_16875 [Anabaena sphaerica FACHB-251]|uniref:DNA-damage-inducible protein D n=1 Tax=Anabaena sphaerica FACHB-251 TaxID=2692883 RepID=A0A926WIL8_9NOST|nr:hypothetical protein [Anabaena sphaerica]MBD2295107.1 hypothetical protein [Anabaena sphaerica FACHB-251]
MNLIAFSESTNPFDEIKQVDENGNEYWLARQLQPLLGYTQWRRFEETIERAKLACQNSGYTIDDHFARFTKSIYRPQGGGTELADYQLTRYAVQLIWENIYITKKYCKRAKKSEKSIQSTLAKELNGKIEIETPCGKIDVLTSTELIEVKAIRNWKEALGQVIVYGDYYPSHQKRIHLYGDTQEAFLSLIRKHCVKRNVIVTWET